MLFKAIESIKPLSSSLAMSVRDNLIATSLNDNILLSDLLTGETLAEFEGDGEQISCMNISADKELLVVASRSLQIHVYSIPTKELVHTFAKAHESAILVLNIDPTSSLAASGGSEGAVKVWDIRNLRLTHNLKGHGSPISAVSFYGSLGDSDWRLASGSEDGKLISWDLVAGKQKYVLQNHANTVTSLYWTSSGEALLSGGRDKIVSIWHDSNLTSTIPIMEEVESIGVIGGYIYVLSPKSIRTLSLTAEVISELKLESDEAEFVRVLNTGNTSELVYVLLSDQSIYSYTVDGNGILKHSKTFSTNHNEVIDLLPYKRKLVLATNSKDLRIANLDENLLEFTPLTGHKDIVLAISVLGRWLLSGGKDREARLWDLETGECKVVFSGHTGPVGAVSLSTGSDIPQFALTGSQDLTVKKWGADGQAIYTRKAHDKDINAIDVSSNNVNFATGSQDRTIKVWNTETGDVVGILKGHKRGVWSVKFGYNNTLISGSGDKCVRMWSLNDYTCIRTFEGHLNSVLKVVPYTSTLVASAGGDGLVKIWDMKVNECAATLDGHEDKVWALSKDSKTNQLISGAGDGVVNIWEDCTEEEQQRVDQEEEDMLNMQQDLDNSIRAKEWDRAIRIALKLNRPLRLLKLFDEVHESLELDSITGMKSVDHVLQNLEGDELYTLLERIRDWNTNGKTSILAQRVLNAILLGPEANTRLKNSKTMALLSTITPYTQRHLNRMSEMLDVSYSLEYILKTMTL